MRSLARSPGSVLAPAILACAAVVLAPGSATAKKGGKEKQASEQTQRAISELAGKFKWGMSPEEVTRIVTDDVNARHDDRIRKESNPAKQDAVRSELATIIDKFKKSYVKFEGQKTGWDVSIVDREFAHKNNEAMMVIWEKDQRRFLFFYRDLLWKQFIAFNAENPAFQGKSFDDFANLIQQRYGPASMTFRKMKTSDDQQLDHLEWPPSGDHVLWAIDLTAFYGNFCLSLWQKSKLGDIEAGRKLNSPDRRSATASIDELLKPGAPKDDANADIIDKITGRDTSSDAADKAPAGKGGKATASSKNRRSGVNARDEDKNKKETAADPLEGSGL